MPRRDVIDEFLNEDIGRGDITSELLIPPNSKARGRIVAKEDCVVAGLQEAGEVFQVLGVEFRASVRDGAREARDALVAEVEGRARAILKGERVALNILQRMSGIATLTRRMVDKARAANPLVVVAATRKTTPGFRAFEKRAVELGGGDPHRFALDDMVLIKDNHVALAGGVRQALLKIGTAREGEGARWPSFTKKVEVEVSTLEDALAAAELGADIVMLDNFKPDDLKAAFEAIKSRHPKVLVEVSGNVTEETVASVAPWADIVSVGALTHSARACDFGLDLEPIK